MLSKENCQDAKEHSFDEEYDDYFSKTKIVNVFECSNCNEVWLRITYMNDSINYEGCDPNTCAGSDKGHSFKFDPDDERIHGNQVVIQPETCTKCQKTRSITYKETNKEYLDDDGMPVN